MGAACGAAGPLLFREMKESGRERWRKVKAIVVVRRERNTGREETEAAEEEVGPRNGRVGASNIDACIVFWEV